MRLRGLCGQPIVHEIWGSFAGWIHEVWINSDAGRVAAFDVCEADRMQCRYVEPFVVHWSFRYGLGVEADPDEWRTIPRQPHWTALRSLDDVLVVQPDGEWSCQLEDIECDPQSWEITSYRLRRRWWNLLATRHLTPDQVLTGGSDVLVMRGSGAGGLGALSREARPGHAARAPIHSTEGSLATQAGAARPSDRERIDRSRRGPPVLMR